MKLGIIAALAAVACAASAAPADSSAALRARFLKPAAQYRTAPFMVWNGDMTEAMIDRQLAGFHDQNVGAVIIHPRPGMVTTYLSDRWFQLIRYTVDQAKKLGMQAWLYDENSYPSGFAGGHVPADMPESWNGGQGLTMRRLDRAPEAGKCRVLLRKNGDGFADVTAGAAPGSAGEYYCFELAYYPKRDWNGGFSYVDLIRPGVTEKFIQITMQGYERTLGADLGTAVPGIFTDEPNIAAPVRASVRWTPDLFEQFQRRWGYDLRPHLVSLFQQSGDWRRVRHNYYGLLLELFIERWSKPWYNYSEAHHFNWTGHYWEHGWPDPIHGGDNMAMYAWHQVPGIDMLFNQFREDVNAQFGNVRAVKELASAANQTGRRRTLSETYGGGGWDLRFEDMKRLGDWEYALGVNLMNQHLSYATMTGARKYDWPQSFSYHEPWWNHYGVVVEYFGRLSAALASGEQINQVLILEPTTSAWMYGGTDTETRRTALGNAFQAFITRLESLQGEYDLGSEDMMKRLAKVTGSRLTVGKRAYDLVVLPPGAESLDTSTVSLLAGYLKAGGKVLAFVDPPARVDGASSGRVTELAARYPSGWVRAQNVEDVKDKLVSGDFRQVEGKLFHQRRQLSDGQLLFFVNSSLDAPARATVAMRGAAITRLDPFTGKAIGYPARAEGTKRVFSFELPPAGSILLLASGSGAPAKPAPVLQETPVSPAAPIAVERLSPNSIRIDYCDLKMAGKEEKDIYFYNAGEKVWKHHGFDANPWNTAVQYKTSILDRGKFAPASGFDATFWFDLDAGVDRTALHAVVERPKLWKVSVNGKPVEAQPGAWWLDRDFGVYDIARLVTPGPNAITISACPMNIHAELEPVYVTGNFGVIAQDHGWKLVAPAPLTTGSWKNQRLPFYWEWVSYARTYTLKRGGSYKVRLGKWAGTVAEVRVNGKPAGIIGWQPYELEIGSLVRDGENRVEVRVCGSLENLLGPHHGKANPGFASPWSFRTAPPHTPPGADYRLNDYGLMEEFSVIAAKGN